MCGIWAYLVGGEEPVSDDLVKEYHDYFMKIQGRGPDNSVYLKFAQQAVLGFQRLCIMDVSEKGNQPFYFETEDKKMAVICNGEIYNFKELIKKEELDVYSGSDCEVLLPLYHKYGIERMLHMLDGVFAFIIAEYNKEDKSTTIIAARDRIGVRPLFVGRMNDNQNIGLCSEIKGMAGIFDTIEVFPPGKYFVFNNRVMEERWETYYHFEYPLVNHSLEEIMENIRNKFAQAVRKRLYPDRPLGCLLSGGLDSSTVCAVAAKILKEEDGCQLKTFSIGMGHATDRKYAKMVADHIGSDHTFVEFTPEEGIRAIRDVIYACETFDITTIRASVGQFLISRWISENTDIKVVLNGDGADEAMKGYQYNHNYPNTKEAQLDSVRLMREIHLYDVIRVDRNISYWGLEARVPFLDTEFCDYYLSIHPELTVPTNGMEKYLFRKAFESTGLLPSEVLWRPKEAFSDGVSGQDQTWYVLIQNYLEKIISDEEFEAESKKWTHCPPKSKEAYYYRKTFDEYFGDKYSNVIPHIWLPNWSGDITEPSARVLDVYHHKELVEVVA